MPAENGSVTPRAAAAATAASTALPPRRNTSSPIAVASASTVATAPPYPIAVGSLRTPPASAGGEVATNPKVVSDSAVSAGRSRIGPPGWTLPVVHICLPGDGLRRNDQPTPNGFGSTAGQLAPSAGRVRSVR